MNPGTYGMLRQVGAPDHNLPPIRLRRNDEPPVTARSAGATTDAVPLPARPSALRLRRGGDLRQRQCRLGDTQGALQAAQPVSASHCTVPGLTGLLTGNVGLLLRPSQRVADGRVMPEP